MLTGDFNGNDRFEIVAEIGGGGMGTVYKAFDHEAKTYVALKVLRTYSPESLLRFKNEFRSLTDLDHPNLVLLGELAEADGCWFFTMELIDGGDFSSYVIRPAERAPAGKKGGNGSSNASIVRFDEPRLRSTIAQMVRGLDFLHRAGKVHCDIKPSNVLVAESGRVVVVDFGLIADTAGPDPLRGPHAAGTLTYMAPEQLEHQGATPAADFYAMGTMIYEAMTGRLPFDGSLAELVVKKHSATPQSPRELDPGIPEDLESLCMALLARQPPDRPEARDILGRLGLDAESLPPSRKPGRLEAESLFVGRHREIDTLLSALEPRNQPATRVIRGASGVGKTALARQFIEVAGPEVLVLEGRCYERENVPFKGIDGIVDALTRFLLSLPDDEAAQLLPDSAPLLIHSFPALRRVEALRVAEVWQSASIQDRRERLFSALRELIVGLAETRRLVLLIDDMHWAGADTWMLLRHLMQPPSAPKLLLLLLTWPSDEGAEESTRADGSTHQVGIDAVATPEDILDLDVLSLAEAQTLTRELLRRGAESSASGTDEDVVAAISDQLAKESGGHPLFIRELVDHVSEAGADTTRQNRLEDALLARIHRLPGPSRELIELVVVAGFPVQQSIMARAADVDFTEYSRAVAPLRRARLVHAPGSHPSDPVEHYHERVRRAVLAYLPGDKRQELHGRLAQVFENEGVFADNPELAVYHLSAAGDGDSAARYAEQAGNQAMAGLAFNQAASFYQTALELGNHGDAAVLRLTLARAEALTCCGRNAKAADLFAQAADVAPDSPTRLDCHRRAAEQLLFSGRLAQGVEALERVLAEIDEQLASSPRSALTSLLWQRARLRLRGLRFTERAEDDIDPRERNRLDVYRTVTQGLGFADNIRAADFQSRHLRLALALGEPARLVCALSMEAFFLASQLARRGRRLAALASEVAERDGAPLSRAYALFAQTGVSYFMDNDWSTALECLLESERLLREHTQSAGFQTDTLRIFRCFCYMQQGDMVRLSRWVPTYISEAERRGDIYAQVSLRSRLLLPWLVAGDPDGAQRELDKAFAAWVPWTEGFSVPHFYGLHSLCEIALYRDQPEVAAAAMAEQLGPLRRSFLLRVPLVRAELDYARVRLCIAGAARAKGQKRAEKLSEARVVARRLARNRIPVARGWSALARAGIARLEGNDDRALRELDSAIAALTEREQAMLTHAARLHRAALIGGQSGADERQQALSWMSDQGIAEPDTLCRMLVAGWS